MPRNLLKDVQNILGLGNKQQQQQQQQQTQQVQQPTTVQQPTEISVLDSLLAFNQNRQTETTKAQAPQLGIPQEQLAGIAGQIDFTKSIPPEALSRLQSGDMGALAEILNSVGRSVYQQGLQHSMGLTNQYIDSRMSYENESLDSRIGTSMSRRNLDSSLREVHPYARKMLQNLAADLRAQYPDASEEDIQHTVQETMGELSVTFGNTPDAIAKRNQEQQRQKAAEPNWDTFGNFDTSGDMQSTVQSQGATVAGASGGGAGGQ